MRRQRTGRCLLPGTEGGRRKEEGGREKEKGEEKRLGFVGKAWMHQHITPAGTPLSLGAQS